MKIILAAGGTGGHIFPALAVAQALKDEMEAVEIIFVGTGNEIEGRLIGGNGFVLRTIHSRPFAGKGLFARLASIASIPAAVIRAVRLHREERPKVVVGFGGYPSFVPVLTAWFMGIPTVIQEQNVEVGLANRVLSLVASRVFAVPGAEGFWRRAKTVHLPNPVRKEFSRIAAWKAPQNNEDLCVLVVGGSQGSVVLNNAAIEQIPLFKKLSVKVVHQTGVLDYERVKAAYAAAECKHVDVSRFIERISEAYSRTHLVVCRAGALTVAEVTAAGRPAIYVPLRLARGHQALNVAQVVASGAALMLEQGPSLGKELGAVLQELLASPEKLATMAQTARNIGGECGGSGAALIAASVIELAA